MLSERFRFHLWLGAPSIGGSRLGPIRGALWSPVLNPLAKPRYPRNQSAINRPFTLFRFGMSDPRARAGDRSAPVPSPRQVSTIRQKRGLGFPAGKWLPPPAF